LGTQEGEDAETEAGGLVGVVKGEGEGVEVDEEDGVNEAAVALMMESLLIDSSREGVSVGRVDAEAEVGVKEDVVEVAVISRTRYWVLLTPKLSTF
jgi:hypothetical protein